MPSINLIEPLKIAARKSEKQLRVSKMTFMGSAIIAAFGYGLLMLQSGDIGGEERKLQEQIAKLKPLVDEIETQKKEVNQLTPRLQTLQDAQKLTGRWGRIMQHLSTNTPPEVWLTGLRSLASDGEKPINLSIVGVAKTQANVSEFALRWQNALDLEAANLRYSQEKMLDKLQAIEFEVGGDIVGTAEKKKVKEEVKPS